MSAPERDVVERMRALYEYLATGKVPWGLSPHATKRDLGKWCAEAADEIERLREALREIAVKPCGIPGHSVARNCGSSAIARRALTGDGEPKPTGDASDD